MSPLTRDGIYNPDNQQAIAQSSISWAQISGAPTTLSGYGITDAISASAIYRAKMSADLTLSASTTSSIGLSFPYAAGEVWTAQTILFINNTAGVGGLTFSYGTLPTGATGRFQCTGPGTTSAVISTPSVALNATSGSLVSLLASGAVQIFTTVRGGTGSGTIDVRVTTGLLQAGTIYQDSFVQAIRIG